MYKEIHLLFHYNIFTTFCYKNILTYPIPYIYAKLLNASEFIQT